MPAERAFSLGSSGHWRSVAQKRIGLGLDAGNCGDVLAVGGENDDAEAGNLNGVAGMNDAAGIALDGLQIGGKIVARDVGVFAVWAVVEEFAIGNAFDQLRHAAYVIDMEVRDEHVIDARDAGVVHGRLNALGVAAVPRRASRYRREATRRRGQRAAWTGRLRRQWSR